MATIEFKNIHKSYGQTEVVKDFNLIIKESEFIVLVGPSGCGKSTTLRMVAGLEEITAGELLINNKIVNDVPPKDRGVAMVFQDYALYPHLSVYDNMAFGPRIKKIDETQIKAKVLKAAAILDLTDYLERKPAALSGGQRQRVAMGRAIVKSVDLFLFDEPLSNLDAKLRSKMRKEIKRFHKDHNITSLYVTHDQLEAMTLADKLVVMNNGKVEQAGPPLEVFEAPKTVFVATFIGSPGMNIIPVNILRENKLVYIEGENKEFKLPLPPEKAKLVPESISKVLLGVRPSDISLATSDDYKNVNIDSESDPWIVKAQVDMIELIGKDAYINLKCGDYEMTGEIFGKESREIEVDNEYQFYINLNYSHLFHTETETNLLSMYVAPLNV